ncbi:MAG: non-canonical purine NTP pyrophosphatase [Candidatus Xenobia bacterium]|jgi:XTP/dITP diphosphohydrolase
MLLLATGNRHKVGELSEILQETGVRLVDLADYPGIPEPVETEPTFEGNAILKARYYHEKTGLAVLADDSGLEVDALDGRPGVQSARYGGDIPHSEKIALVLEELGELPDELRTARFRCVAVLVDAQGQLTVSPGAVEGLINYAPRGEGGFGYDPIFYLPEHGCTMAELPSEVKNSLSHRGRAVRGLFSQIQALID